MYGFAALVVDTCSIFFEIAVAMYVFYMLSTLIGSANRTEFPSLWLNVINSYDCTL